MAFLDGPVALVVTGNALAQQPRLAHHCLFGTITTTLHRRRKHTTNQFLLPQQLGTHLASLHQQTAFSLSTLLSRQPTCRQSDECRHRGRQKSPRAFANLERVHIPARCSIHPKDGSKVHSHEVLVYGTLTSTRKRVSMISFCWTTLYASTCKIACLDVYILTMLFFFSCLFFYAQDDPGVMMAHNLNHLVLAILTNRTVVWDTDSELRRRRLP